MDKNSYVERLEREIQAQPFARLMGLTVEEAGEGYAVTSCRKREDLLQQTGAMHGGAIGAVCEAGGGLAAMTMLPENMTMIGGEYKINFLRAVTADRVIVTSRVIKRGRSLYVMDVEARGEGSDQLAVKMILTAMPVEKEG